MPRVNTLVCDECGAALPYGHPYDDEYKNKHELWHKNLDEKYKLLLKSLYKDILDLEVQVAQLPSVIEARERREREGETNA